MVTLRPLQPSDAEHLQRWSEDEETRRLQAGRRIPHTEESAAVEVARILDGHGAQHVAFMVEANGQVIGNCWLGHIDPHNQSATLGIVIAPEARGQGYGAAALEDLLAYGFEDLELERIELWARADNRDAIRLYERAGFRREGVRRRALRWNQDRVDLVAMAMLDADWRAKYGEHNG